MLYEPSVEEGRLPAKVSGIPDDDALLAPLRKYFPEPYVLGGVILKGKIGEGGMAGVYLGWHTRLRFPVAVKVLIDPSPPNLAQFLREACFTVCVDHPNLVRIFDVNVEPVTGLHYIVMEYVEGCSAYELLLRQMRRHQQPLSTLSTVEIGLSAARALGAAHRQGILHRDVKSDNILIRERDGTVKLADLGFAGLWRKERGPPRNKHHTVGGTTGFISPELLRGGEAAPAGDVYALGVTLYELLSGWLPYGAPYDDSYYARQLSQPPPALRERVPGVDRGLAALVHRCLESNPQHRFADGEDLAAELENIRNQLAGTKLSPASNVSGATAPPAPAVLCVDDDEEVLKLLRDILEAQGFRPVCFADSAAALASLRSVQPDVAVLDLNMPGLDGLQLCEKLRQVDGYQELAVLIVSGENRPAAIRHAFDRGITDYLPKPVSAVELAARVRLLYQLRTMDREKRRIETQLLKLKEGQRSSNESDCLTALASESA